jgi:trehalose utilization protein
MQKITVMIWDENTGVPEEVYPQGIRGAVAAGLRELGGERLDVHTAHLEESEQGLPVSVLSEVDVLVWWGHKLHDQVTNETVARIFGRVHRRGMGFIALHSAHYSWPFQQILGGRGHLRGGWDEAGGPEEIVVCAPAHPIAAGISSFTLPEEEMYGAPFEVPPPEVVVFQSHFPKSKKFFPSGLTWTVGEGKGRVFYFRPGHETLPTYKHQEVKKILHNAVLWCAKVT